MLIFKMHRHHIIASIAFYCLVSLAISILLPTNPATAGWMDDFIREGTKAILNSPNSGNNQNDQGVNVNRACSSAFLRQPWGQIACIFGGSLVNMLGQEDQRELADSTEETIATGRDSGWSNPDTGVEGKVKVTGTKVNRQTSEVAVLDTVQKLPPLDLVAGEFRAISNANIVTGPGNNYRSVGYLTKGQIVQVIAKVQNRGWYLLSQDGIGSGYVTSNALKPTGRIKVSGNSPKPQYQGQKKVKRVRVETKQTCKTIEQRVTLEDGSTHRNSVEACPEPDGTWDIA